MTNQNKDQDRGVNVSKAYHCGTLTYTKAGLVAIFAWLLWGDFCFTLMEAVVPSVLPLKLKALGSPNWLMGVILSTIPGILNMTICPWVSFKSDRHRSRWGRRIPFIVWTLPFLCLSLALLGCSDPLSSFLQKNVSFLSGYAPATITIILIAAFMAVFQFFNMFVGSVFWYLFNDVVPPQFLGRFVGAFRIVGTLAGATYNYFIFKYAEFNMREILVGASLLYFVGFVLMCLMVREGEYPPVEGETDKDKKGWGTLKTFFQECFTHKFYWLFFLFTSFPAIAGVLGTFNVFFYRDMGLSLDQIGKFTAVAGIAAPVAMYFAAIFVDRWHPLRVYVYMNIFVVIASLANWTWVFVTLPAIYFFWLCIGNTLIATFQNALIGGASLPMYMRLLPKSRYGQFCSAQAIVRSFCTVVMAVVAGAFIDLMKWFCNGTDFAYRFIFIWITIFNAIAAVLGIWMYVYWHKLGADENYHPPAPWSPDKKETMETVPSIGPQARWLKISFCLFDALMMLSVSGIPPMMWWMYRNDAMFAFKWHAILILPLSLAAWFCWKIVAQWISRDMEKSLAAKPLCNGQPHHGVLMVVVIKYLLALPIWAVQVVVTINLKMELGCIIFGIANVLTNFLLIGSVVLLRVVECWSSDTLEQRIFLKKI